MACDILSIMFFPPSLYAACGMNVHRMCMAEGIVSCDFYRKKKQKIGPESECVVCLWGENSAPHPEKSI